MRAGLLPWIWLGFMSAKAPASVTSITCGKRAIARARDRVMVVHTRVGDRVLADSSLGSLQVMP